MSNRNPRNQSLLAQLSERNSFKATLAPRIFEIGTAFDRDIEAINLDGRLSAEGKRDKAKGRVQEALLALDDVQKPIADYRKQTESLRSGIKRPAFDKPDSLDRWKIRDRALTMSLGQKTMRMIGPKRSKTFVDAVVFEFEDDPWLSGIDLDNPNERELYETAKQERLRDLNGELMDALEARARTEAKIMMVADVVRNDIQSDAAHLASRAA